MGDENPIRTLGDYSKPTHKGYRNTISFPKGTTWYLFNLTPSGWCKTDAHSTDFGSISTWEDLATRFLAQFFPSGRTTKLRNDILMFQQHHGESLSEAWTRFQDLLQKVPHHGIDRWLQIQIFYIYVSFHHKCEIDRAVGRKIRNKNTNESWEIIENLALYDQEDWDETNEFIKPVKAISTPRGVPKTPDRRLLKLEDQINFLLKGSLPTPALSLEHTPKLMSMQEGEGSSRTKETPDNIEKLTEIETEMPVMEVKKMNKVEKGAKDKPIKTSENEEALEAPGSQPIAYYLKHKINEKLIKGLVNNNKFNNSRSRTQTRKKKGKEYKILPGGPAYEVILKKKITKKEDIGGNFEIPCNIGNLKHVNALIDQGIAEDVLVKVAEHVYPVDFVILDIRENENRPFILGTPFLSTTKASIKFDTGTITLRSRKSKVSLHRIPDSSNVTDKGVKNDIEPIAPTITVNRLVLEWEKKTKLHMEREMKFNQWRSKNFKGKRPTLVATEEDEG
ncbi:MAK10-like protein [Tanacetum coccineum]